MKISTRRQFIQKSACLAGGLASIPFFDLDGATAKTQADSLYIIGPQEGYSPHIGALLSMMTMMRTWVVYQVRELTTKQLDFQVDDKSNSIGAMLWHLAATERYYQLNTFEEMEWGTWGDEVKKEWDVASHLGEEAREKIKGHNIDFYLAKLNEVRNLTKKEFAKRDDEWLMKSESFFENEPTNNYAKWFHVCEHESNHNGQIKFIKKRFT